MIYPRYSWSHAVQARPRFRSSSQDGFLPRRKRLKWQILLRWFCELNLHGVGEISSFAMLRKGSNHEISQQIAIFSWIFHLFSYIWGFHKMENPIKMDGLGGTTISGNPYFRPIFQASEGDGPHAEARWHHGVEEDHVASCAAKFADPVLADGKLMENWWETNKGNDWYETSMASMGEWWISVNHCEWISIGMG